MCWDDSFNSDSEFTLQSNIMPLNLANTPSMLYTTFQCILNFCTLWNFFTGQKKTWTIASPTITRGTPLRTGDNFHGLIMFDWQKVVIFDCLNHAWHDPKRHIVQAFKLVNLQWVTSLEVCETAFWGKLPRTLTIETPGKNSEKIPRTPTFCFPNVLGVCKLDQQRLLSLISRKATSKVPPKDQKLGPRD